jgi:hypothetical protein
MLTSIAMAKGEKLALVGSGAPDPKDNLLIENLEKWGYVVEPHAHGAKHPVNLAGIDLVFISESTSSANILGAYKDSTVPVVNAESFTYDNMGFAPDGTFNSDAGDKITIVDTEHPITNGFKGDITVSQPAAQLMTCNGLDGDVDILAVRADKDDFVAISVYEKGAETLQGATKARHINIWPHSTAWQNVTEDGWELIHRSILYGLGQIAADVAPEDKLTVTWGQIKTAR